MPAFDNLLWVYLTTAFFVGVVALFILQHLFNRPPSSSTPPVLTAAWAIRLFESEGEPSVRLILACVVVVFSLVLEAIKRISDAQLEANFFLAATLLGLGTAKLVGRAFANRPQAPPAQVNANKAQFDVAGDANISTPAGGQP